MVAGLKRSYAEAHEVIDGSSAQSSRLPSPETNHSRPVSPVKPTNDRALQASDDTGPRPSVPRPSRWDPNTSIVLVGLQGSGKSSLAVLAASAYNRRVVEFENEFKARTGQAIASHRHSVDITEHHRIHRHIFAQVLEENSTGSVIVCSFADLERGGRVLRHFAQDHPVIHVSRDVEGICSQVEAWTVEKARQMLAVSGRLLRSCTNYEFFNCTENDESYDQGDYVHPERANEDVDLRSGAVTPTVQFLKLKRAERDFLKFLRMILGDLSRTPSHQSAYPLSQIPIEHRKYTYAVAVNFADILNDNINMDQVLTGADALQIVYTSISSDLSFDTAYMLGEVFSRARRATILPTIIELEFSTYASSERDKNLYAQHLRHCLRYAPEYLVVNTDIDDALFRSVTDQKASTTIIAQASNVHNLHLKWDDEQCLELIKDAEHAGADLVQLAGCANSVDDNAAVSAFRYATRSCSIPVSAFNYGHLGRPSQCLNPGLTPLTAESLEFMTDTSTICSITAKRATRALFGSSIFDPLDFCILGSAVQFSLSPAMHNAAYDALGLPHRYEALSAAKINVVSRLSSNEYCGGIAVTQPYKVEVLRYLTSLSKHASIIRAVNTVLPVRRAFDNNTPTDLEIINTRNTSGHIYFLHGDNTDWIGIRACVRRGLSPINTVRSHSCGLIIGAGGMARASIYAMLHMGVRHIFVYSRTVSTAEELAEYYNTLDPKLMPGGPYPVTDNTTGQRPKVVHVLRSMSDPWPSGYRPPTMIVSSVPAQRTASGNLIAPFTLPPDWLKSPTGGVLLEHTYEPLETDLVRQVRAQSHRGWIVMTGLDMLPEQAFAQFELFTGRRAPRRIMRTQVLLALRGAAKRTDDAGQDGQ